LEKLGALPKLVDEKGWLTRQLEGFFFFQFLHPAVESWVGAYQPAGGRQQNGKGLFKFQSPSTQRLKSWVLRLETRGFCKK